MDLALTNLQRLICHKTQPTNHKEQSEARTCTYIYQVHNTIYTNNKDAFRIKLNIEHIKKMNFEK